MPELFCLVIAVAVLFSAIAFYLTLALFFIVSMVYPIYCYRQKYGTLEFWKDVGWTGYRPVVRCSHCGHMQKLRDDTQLTGSHLRGLRPGSAGADKLRAG